MAHRLKLFRRHSTQCTQGYPKDLRITEADTLKATGRRQCSCTIVAQGTLPNGNFLKHPSTGETSWTEAHKVGDLWWQWGDITPPADVVREIRQAENSKSKLLSEALEDWITAKQVENPNGIAVHRHHKQLQCRMVAFAAVNGFEYVQQMDSAEPWQKFRESWSNENPLHNKKGMPTPKAKTVAQTTARRMLGQVRQFHRFCVGRSWLSQVWAGRDYIKVKVTIDPKDPFSDEDVAEILNHIKYITNGGKTDQLNAQQVLAFVLALRYSGLRISDAVKLDADNLVNRPGKDSLYSLRVFMKKTSKWVYIPIPSGEIPGAPNVAKVLQALPLIHGRFLFYDATETSHDKRMTNSWYERLSHLFGLVEEHGVRLSVHPHPHRFRHTYAARLLEMGMDVRDVAEYLGDSVSIVLKHYGKFTTKQQAIAADRWEQAMLAAADSRKSKLKIVK
jgi:integrase